MKPAIVPGQTSAAILAAALPCPAVEADEGMWTFDNPPSGQVMGYPANGTRAPYKTTMYGLYDRAASFDYKVPFDLPKRYVDGNKLELSTPFNFVTTNDIPGGDSGSPVVNRNGDVVGLIFGVNIQSLVGDFVYDSYQNHAVAVHTGAMTEALKKLDGAQKRVDELMGH